MFPDFSLSAFKADCTYNIPSCNELILLITLGGALFVTAVSMCATETFGLFIVSTVVYLFSLLNSSSKPCYSVAVEINIRNLLKYPVII